MPFSLKPTSSPEPNSLGTIITTSVALRTEKYIVIVYLPNVGKDCYNIVLVNTCFFFATFYFFFTSNFDDYADYYKGKFNNTQSTLSSWFFICTIFSPRFIASCTFLSCASRRLKNSSLSSYGRGPRMFLHWCTSVACQ